jgi:hypothetical protein
LKIVVLDKLIEIYAEHFERDAYVISESETISNTNHISLILRIIISQHGKNFNFYFPLFMQFFLIFQDFHSDLLFLRVCMVYAADDYTKGTPTKFFYDLVSVIDLIGLLVEVVTILGIETVVKNLLTIYNLGRWILLLGS